MRAGSDGVVHTWDLRMRRCVERVADEGALGAASLAAAPSGRLLATGSSSGVVNVYARPRAATPDGANMGRPMLARAGKPLKALMNLVTTVDTLAFSPDSQACAPCHNMITTAELSLGHTLSSCTSQHSSLWLAICYNAREHNCTCTVALGIDVSMQLATHTMPCPGVQYCAASDMCIGMLLMLMWVWITWASLMSKSHMCGASIADIGYGIADETRCAAAGPHPLYDCLQ